MSNNEPTQYIVTVPITIGIDVVVPRLGMTAEEILAIAFEQHDKYPDVEIPRLGDFDYDKAEYVVDQDGNPEVYED